MKKIQSTRFLAYLATLVLGCTVSAQGLTFDSPPYTVVAGEAEVFQIDFDVPAPDAGTMNILFNANDIANITATVPYAAGDTFVPFTVAGIQPGQVSIEAVTFPDDNSPLLSTATAATVTFTAPELQIFPNPLNTLSVGQSNSFILYRSGNLSAELPVQFENTNPSVATLSANSYTFAVGEAMASPFITVTGLQAGTTQFRFRVGSYVTPYFSQTVTLQAAPPQITAIAHGDLDGDGSYSEGDTVLVLFNNEMDVSLASDLDNWFFYLDDNGTSNPSPNSGSVHWGVGASIVPIDLNQYPYTEDPADSGATESRAFKVTLGVGPVVNSTLYLTQGPLVLDEFGLNNLGSVPLAFPSSTDSNGDGLTDIWYLNYDLDPTGPSVAGDDWDNDGLNNYWEFVLGADPMDPNSLDATLTDGQFDSSGDGLSNDEKIQLGLNPSVLDSDDNGIWDIHELEIGTDPGDDISPFVLRYLENDGTGRVEVPAIVPGIDDQGERFDLNNWTIETLVYLDAEPVDDVILIQRRAEPFDFVTFELGIRAVDRLPYVRFQSPSGQTGTPGITAYEVIGVEQIPLGEWMMLGGRWGFNTSINQQEISLFQNGARVRQRVLNVLNATGPQSGPLILGENLIGKMDETRIWGRWIPDEWVKSNISKTTLFGRDSVIQGALAPRSGRLETISNDYIIGTNENFTLQAWVRTVDDTVILSSNMGAPPQEIDTSFIAHNYHLEVDGGNLVGRVTFVYSGLLFRNPNAPPPQCLNAIRWATHEIQGGFVANGEWNHVALVRDGNNISLYINGRPSGQGKNVQLFSSADGGSNRLHLGPGEERSPCDGTVVGLASRLNTPVYVGGNTIDDTTLIDEVSLYAEALSPEFLQENFLNAAPSRPTLRMHYTFDFVDVALGFVTDSASLANAAVFDGNATVVLEADSNAPIISDNRSSLSAIMAGYFHYNDGGEFVQDAVQSRDIRNYTAASGVMTGGVSRTRIIPIRDGLGNLVDEDHIILANELQTSYPVFFPLPAGSPYRLDSDGDGMPDVFEAYFGLAPNDAVPPNRPEVGPWGDLSGNGLPNIYEYWAGTDPRFWSSRGDGVSDADWDSDGDGLSNISEFMMGAHPGRTDTDNNGISDSDELNPHMYGRVNNPTHSMDPLDLESPNPRLRPKAMRLNAAVNRLQVPRPVFDLFRFNSSTWTVETWYRPDATGQTGSLMEYIGRRWESAGGNPTPSQMVFWRLGLNAGRPFVEFQTGEVQTPHRLDAPAEIPVAWSHLAASYNMANRMLTLYVDGVPVRQREVVGQPLSGGDTVSRIPGRFWLGDTNLRGLMNDVRLWHVARTPAQIQRGMTKLVQVNEPGLVSYYRFDDGRQGDLNDPTADGDGSEDGRGAEDFANRVQLPDLERAWSYSLRGLIFEPVSLSTPISVPSEILAVANGTSASYNGFTLHKNLVPGSFTLTVGARAFVDNGFGLLLGGLPGDTGTIDYSIGAWTVNFVAPVPLNSENFDAGYSHYPNNTLPPWARQGFDDRNQDGLPDWWEDLYYSVNLEFFPTVRDTNNNIVQGPSQRAQLVSSDSFHNALHTLGWTIDLTPLESVANVRLWEQPDAAHYIKSFSIMDIPQYAELRLVIHTLVDESELIRTEVRLNGARLDLTDSRILPSPNTFRSPDGANPTEIYLPSSMILPHLRQGHNVMAVKMVNTNPSSLNPYTYEFFDAQLLVDGQYYIRKANAQDASIEDRRWWVWGRLGSLEEPPRDFAGRQWFEPGYGNAALDDLDHDGLTNIQEFELGLNPAATDSSNLDAASGLPLLGAGDPDLASGWYAGLIPDSFRIQPGTGLTNSELANPGDQIPFGWKLNFLNVLDAYRFVKWDDPDGDGWNNFQEFLAGTDPGDSLSTPSPNEMRVNVLWNEIGADADVPIIVHFWRTSQMDGPKIATGEVNWINDGVIGQGTLELTSGRFWPDMYGLFFADLNGNGEWDEGEPAGFATEHPVPIKFGATQAITVPLTTTVAGYTRWHFEPVEGQTHHTARMRLMTTDGASVIYTRVVRGRNYLHEKDFQLAGFSYHLPNGTSQRPQYQLFVKGENQPDSFYQDRGLRALDYSQSLSTPSQLSPSGQLRYANTSFSWVASQGVVTAYLFQLMRNGTVIYDRTFPAPIARADGRITYTPDFFWGVAPFDSGEYTWRVMASNPSQATNWPAAPSIFLDLTSQSNGPHDISGIYWYMGRSSQGNFVFEAFDNPGFMGRPVQRAVVSDIGEWRLRGLPAGRYYIRGYRDVLGQGSYSAWHPVGYLRSPTPFSAYWQPQVVELRPLQSGSSGHHIVIHDVDTDNDGFSDAWEMQTYGNLSSANSGVANVPYAEHSTMTGGAIQGLLPLDLSLLTADGYSLVAMILLGYDPNNPADRPPFPLAGGNFLELQGLDISNNQVWIDFNLLSGLNLLTRPIGVEVQYTTDLTSNLWFTIPTSRTEIGPGAAAWSLSPGMLPGTSGIFYRVRWFPLIP